MNTNETSNHTGEPLTITMHALYNTVAGVGDNVCGTKDFLYWRLLLLNAFLRPLEGKKQFIIV
jgi:hypothetical protein